MSRVKGSVKKRVKVVEYRLRSMLSYCLLLVAGVVCAIASAYYMGHKFGMAGQEQALKDVARLTTDLDQWRTKALGFEQLIENTKTAAEVDRNASEDVRQEVIVLKDEIAKLTEENSFYRGLMAPNDKSSGLSIGSVELVRARDSENYNYKVVVQQLATRHNVLSGTLSFTVFGRQNGIEARYPLMVLSGDVNEEKIKLRFKYFQVVEGELGLPEGFEAEGIEIEANTGGKKPQQAFKKFGWLVEEV